jgi:outer membrane biosynthesis protein TonB
MALAPYLLKWLPKSKVTPSETIRVTLIQPAPPPPPPPPPEPPLPEPQQKMFVDSAELIPTETPKPTPFEGEKTTRAASAEPAIGDPNLPSQTGERLPALTLRESPQSPETQSEPAPPTPEPAKEPDQPKPAPKEKEAVAKAAPKPTEPLPLRTMADLQVRKDEAEEEAPKPEKEKKKEEQTAETAQPRAPPTSFSAQRRRTQIDGGGAPGSDSSVEVQESDLGKYKARLYRAIGSRWYIYVQNDNGLLRVGTVRIRFFVRSDGTISQLEIVQGRDAGALMAVSRRSIMEVNGQLPFPEAVRKQVGDGFYDEVTFTIY